jgi:hypothetical protein
MDAADHKHGSQHHPDKSLHAKPFDDARSCGWLGFIFAMRRSAVVETSVDTRLVPRMSLLNSAGNIRGGEGLSDLRIPKIVIAGRSATAASQH